MSTLVHAFVKLTLSANPNHLRHQKRRLSLLYSHEVVEPNNRQDAGTSSVEHLFAVNYVSQNHPLCLPAAKPTVESPPRKISTSDDS